jgi:hypothetical protein|tara:strand:- start:8396 stop:8803 length:408 start_codon:yes stop_codon:yes gene_type:complete
MARIAGKNADFSYNSVAIEDELNTLEMSVDNNLPEVTAFGDDGAEFVEGLPNSSFSLSGSADFAASQGDATIFTQIGSGEAAYIYQPTGGAAGANDPNYTGNALVSNYTITSDVSGSASYSATLQANGKPTRAVS